MMKNRPIMFLGLLLGWAAGALATDDPGPGFSLELIESRKIWDKALFNGFTDLERFKGDWYVVLREGTAHGVWDGNIRILRSKDGDAWESAAFIRCPEGPAVDLRDGKLSVTPEGELMLTSSAYWPTDKCTSYAWFSSDGISWGQPVKIGPPGEWLWRTVWHDGVAYNFARDETCYPGKWERSYLQLYRSRDGKEFTKLGPKYFEGRYPNETAPVFTEDGTCYVLLRRDIDSNTAQLGKASPPYDRFTWTDLGVRIGGPEMIQLPNGQFLAAVRLYDAGEYTALCYIDHEAGSLTKMLRIPSGGDTSYAGLVLDEDNVLWVSYYSSHEDKTNVYLAKVKVAFDDPALRDVIDIGTQKQLFIDDYIIASSEGVYKKLNRPVKYEGNPVLELKPTQEVGGEQLVIAQGSVLFDDEDKLFKMWYEGAVYGWTDNVIAYAYSQDGVNWTLPNLGLVDYHGSKNNNIVVHTGAGEMAPGVFKDTWETDPQKKFKMLYFSKGNGSPVAPAFSPDGVHWKNALAGQWIPYGDSLHPCLNDPKTGKYIAHSRRNVRMPDGSEQRRVLQSESDDFINWDEYGVIVQPDEEDPLGHRQFYDMSWMNYEGVQVGFMSVYHLAEGELWDKVDVQLTFSRDNRNWMRAGGRETFIANSTTPGEYDYGIIYTMHRPIVVGDEIWIYYTGYSGLHWATRRKEIQGGTACLAKLRLDGFVSIDTGARGSLTTKAIRVSGDKLIINAKSKYGSIKVEILDANGNPIKGFGLADADAVTGDSVRHAITWNGKSDISSLKDESVKLRFHLDRCKLYSFTVSQQYLNAAKLPVDVGTQKQLFIDDYLVESSSGVVRTLHQPVKDGGNPVIASSGAWEKYPYCFGTVIYDEEESIYKLWYTSHNFGYPVEDRTPILYATSADGVNWDKPSLGLFSYRGSTDNNIVLTNYGYHALYSPSVVKDPLDANPDRRYKMIWWDFVTGPEQNVDAGMCVAFSPDGINWTKYSGNRVLPTGEGQHYISDIMDVMYDGSSGKFVAYTKGWADPWPNYRNIVRTESTDFVNWTAPQLVLDHAHNAVDPQSYGMPVIHYESVYLGLMRSYKLPGDETIDIQLAISHDNQTWERVADMATFIPLGPSGSWDDGMIFTVGPIVRGDTIEIFYGGWDGPHNVTPTHTNIGVARLRKDGFVSLDASSAGALTTKKLIMAGDKLLVNANARHGSIEIEVLDEAGNPIQGFKRTDADAVTRDNIRNTITWNASADVSSLKGRAISLKFYLYNCKLYSFVFHNGS